MHSKSNLSHLMSAVMGGATWGAAKPWPPQTFEKLFMYRCVLLDQEKCQSWFEGRYGERFNV